MRFGTKYFGIATNRPCKIPTIYGIGEPDSRNFEQPSSGIYTYLLMGDSKTSEAKNMILTK
jgi:hypothetical protein